MRTLLLIALATTWLTLPALALAATLPSDKTGLTNDDKLSNDDATMQQSDVPVTPPQGTLTLDRQQIARATDQLNADTRQHAAKATLKADKKLLSSANHQLQLDQKTCQKVTADAAKAAKAAAKKGAAVATASATPPSSSSPNPLACQ